MSASVPPPSYDPLRLTELNVKVCPRCAEGVLEAAKVCRHCGHEFRTDMPARERSAIRAGRVTVVVPVLGFFMGLLIFEEWQTETAAYWGKRIMVMNVLASFGWVLLLAGLGLL